MYSKVYTIILYDDAYGLLKGSSLNKNKINFKTTNIIALIRIATILNKRRMAEVFVSKARKANRMEKVKKSSSIFVSVK